MLSPSIRLFSRQKSSPLLIRTFALSESSIRTSTLLRTLRPERIVESGQEIFDLSGLTRKSITVPFEHPRWPSPRNAGGIFKLNDRKIGTTYVPFPDNTRGFFYYRHGITDLAGSVRFRLCDSAATFESGHDLARNDSPWQPQLVDIVSSANLRPLIPLLLAEQLVDESVLVDAAQIHIKHMSAKHRFYSFSEPFTLNLNNWTFGSLFITRKSFHAHNFRDLYHERRSGAIIRIPYSGEHPIIYSLIADLLTANSGRIQARFEISTFPEHAKLGPCLVLKCLDIIDPIKCVAPDYDGYIGLPRPGSYHTRAGKLWCFPLKRKLDIFRDMMEQEGILPTS